MKKGGAEGSEEQREGGSEGGWGSRGRGRGQRGAEGGWREEMRAEGSRGRVQLVLVSFITGAWRRAKCVV